MMNRSKNNKKFLNILVVFIISLSLVLVWFRKGLIMGGGEGGLPFYNPARQKELVAFTWNRGTIGIASGIAMISVLFNWFAQSLVTLGLSQVFVQGLYFFFLLFAGGLGVLFLTKEVFGDEKTPSFVSLIAALFYTLNPMSLMGVWHRFQYPFMFFYALMPLALFIFVRGLRSENLVYAFFFNIACLIFSTAFTSFPLLELFWLVIGSYFLFYLLVNWQNKKKAFFAFKFFLLTFFLWISLNLWWLPQFLNSLFATEFITGQAATQLGDILTFRAISERLGRLLYLFRFIHKTYFEELAEVWGPIYFSPLFLTLGFLLPIFTFGSLLVKKKPKLYWYFALLSLLGLFFAKGSAPPLGQIFLFAFSHLRPLEPFRNPFEKIGLILPLGFAPLFALGLTSFYSWLKKLNQKLALCSLSIVSCSLFIIYSFPMWNGLVFTGTFPPTNNSEVGICVKVPGYYEEASQWLNQDKSDFRAIALPIGGEGINHKWEYGYNGVELSHTLFDKPFISLNTAVPYLNGLVSPLEDFFLKNAERFYKLMGLLNSKYLMVRWDINYQLINMKNPAEIKKKLEERGEEEGVGNEKIEMGNAEREMSPESEPSTIQDKPLEFVKKFGELEFYKVSEDSFLPHFYVANSVAFVDQNLQNPYLPLSFDDFRLKEAVVSSQEGSSLPLGLANKIYISADPHPKKKIEIVETGRANYLPGSKLYPFLQWKEKRLEKRILATGDSEKIIDLNLGLANKRLGEIERLVEKREEIRKKLGNWEIGKLGEEFAPEDAELRNLEVLIKESWKKFAERLNLALALLQEIESQGKDASETAYRILEYVKFFQGQFVYLLSGEGSQTDLPAGLKSLLVVRQLLEEKTWVIQDGREKRHLIDVPKEGEYELFVSADTAGDELTSSDGHLKGIFGEDPFRPMDFALDGKPATVSGVKKGNHWFSFGQYWLNEGRHQLQVFLPSFVNLAQQENFTLSAKKGEAFVLPLDNFLKGGRDFSLSFDYRIKGGNLPRIIIAQKIKVEGEDRVQKMVDTILPKSEYSLKYLKSFTNNPTAEQAAIRLFFEEQGDSELRVENFQATRDWRPEVVLRMTTENTDKVAKKAEKVPKISFRRINPTKYEVWVKEAEDPYLLVFSESFHPGWKAYIEKIPNTKCSLREIPSECQIPNNDGKVLASYFDGEIIEREHKNDFLYREMFEILGRKSIPEDRHLLANGYANSWLIKPEDVEGKGSYRLIVEFWPQRLFYVGLGISGLTLVGCLVYLRWRGIKRN